MWFCRKKDGEKERIPPATAAALIVSVLSLALAAGVARWSWLILDEQIRLRQDFMQLQSSQDQLNAQYEFWSRQLQKERYELQELKASPGQ